jgi:hypothetical protein
VSDLLQPSPWTPYGIDVAPALMLYELRIDGDTVAWYLGTQLPIAQSAAYRAGQEGHHGQVVEYDVTTTPRTLTCADCRTLGLPDGTHVWPIRKTLVADWPPTSQGASLPTAD